MRFRIPPTLLLGLVGSLVAGAALAALPPGGTFTDDNGNVHEANIEAIAAEGITKGCNPPSNDIYCPSSPVTRGQMAAFLNRGLICRQQRRTTSLMMMALCSRATSMQLLPPGSARAATHLPTMSSAQPVR